MGEVNKKRICALLAALTLFLSGCGASTADELYALPRLSDAYLQLQNEINELLDEGAEYSAPSSGSNRQAVQLEDIDGDGVKEALAFLSQPGASKPQKIVIFQSVGGKYTEVARIEGEGSGIDSISYLDMDGSPGREIAVGWRIASGMNILSVYSMRGFQPAQILNTDYTRFSAVDIDDNGTTDVVVLRLSSSEENGEAAMYSLQEDGEMASSTVLLSQGIRSLARVRSGRLMDGRPSLIVESTIGVSGLITDVLACWNGAFQNITLDAATGASDTARSSQVWCRDINGDDVLDIPKLEPMPALPEAGAYYLTIWSNYTVYGRSARVATTFTNNTDSWYLIIPELWVGKISVRRRDEVNGERGVVFSYIGDGVENAEDFLTVYTLSGDNKEERASAGGRFALNQDEDKLYAAEITEAPGAGFTVTEELIKQNFRVLYSEWITGD